MPRRKSLKTEASNYLKQAGGSLIFWGCTAWAISRYTDTHVDWMLPLIVAPVTPVLYRVLDSFKMPTSSITVGYVTGGLQAKQSRGRFESLTRWSIGGYGQQHNPDDWTTRQIRYKEPVRREMCWKVQLTNRMEPIEVYESDLLDFVRRVSSRQRAGLPYPFSRNYFKRSIPEAEYRGMVRILEISGIVGNRTQGASGRLRVLTPYAAMWQIRTTFSPGELVD